MTSRHLFSRLLGAILVVSALASCSDGGKKPPHESSAKPEDVLDKIVIDNPKPNKNDPFGIGKHDKTIKHSKTVKYVIASKQRGLKSSTTSTIRIDAKTRITEVGQAYLITGHPSGTKDKNTATSADNIATDIGTAGALDPDKSMVSVTIDKKTRRIQSMETRIVMTHNGKVVAEQTDSLKYDWNPVDVSVPPEAKSAVDG